MENIEKLHKIGKIVPNEFYLVTKKSLSIIKVPNLKLPHSVNQLHNKYSKQTLFLSHLKNVRKLHRRVSLHKQLLFEGITRLVLKPILSKI